MRSAKEIAHLADRPSTRPNHPAFRRGPNTGLEGLNHPYPMDGYKKMKLKYECPKCKVKSYSKYWNAETRKRYDKNGDGICEIQQRENNSFHICPVCKEESEMFKGDLIEEVNPQ